MNTKYGVRIKTFSVGSLYAYNLGVRDKYDYKDAMLTNSLLLMFLENNNLLNITRTGETRDIVSLNFDYKSYSFDEEHNKIQSKLADAIAENNQENIDFFKARLKNLKEIKEKFNEKSIDEIRDEYYRNGVDVEYTLRKDNRHNKKLKVHYVMLYRSTGKAKQGSCLFIRDDLYDVVNDFMCMGLKLPKTNAQIVELGAYKGLIASTIVGTVTINPKDIFIMPDLSSETKTTVISVELNENDRCVAKLLDDYKISADMFDGQGLIDSSIFPSWADGYVLLRQHFCKMACFKTHIQKFFKDYFGDKYETATLTDIFGQEHRVKDIKLITTNNAVKFLKFQVSYDYWCDKVGQLGNKFGVVKTAHESKLGEVQRMSYQMINTLNVDIMPNVMQKSIDYINLLKADDIEFLHFLQRGINFANDYEFLLAVCNRNPDFMQSKYFRTRKKEIIRQYVKDIKQGRIIQNADNLVMVGSPYAMLLHSVGEDVENDPTLNPEEDTIQCYTNRFDFGKHLACFRSPHNSSNNIGYLHNVYSEEMDRYFDLGRQILAVNTRHTDIEDRLNGCDFDSDMCYVTDQEDIVSWAKTCYEEFPTIVNNVPKSSKRYNNTPADYAIVDNQLAKSQSAIGESSNVAQIAQSYLQTYKGTEEYQKYYDATCILSVLAQIAVDSSKRSFACDVNREILAIKQELGFITTKDEDGDVIPFLPRFWKSIQKPKIAKRLKYNSDSMKNWTKKMNAKINNDLVCPMNILSESNAFNSHFRNKSKTIDTIDFVKTISAKEDRYKVCRYSKKVETLIAENSWIFSDKTDDYYLVQDQYDRLINDLQTTYLSKNAKEVMNLLTRKIFDDKIDLMINNRPILLNILYYTSPNTLLESFKTQEEM